MVNIKTFLAALRRGDGIAGLAKDDLQQLHDGGVVIDNQNR